MKGKALALAAVLMAGLAGGCSQTEIAMEPADPSYILTTTVQKGYLTDENSQRGYLTSEVRETGSGSVTLYVRATKPEQAASEVTLSYAPELVEASIYEINALKARSDYLLRCIKTQLGEGPCVAASSVKGGTVCPS